MITSQHPLPIVIQTPKNDLGTAVTVHRATAVPRLFSSSQIFRAP
jgi:hypothetical protein